MFGGELLGWGVSTEVIRLQPDSVPYSKAEVLSFPIGIALVRLLCLFDGQLTTRLYLMDVMESLRESQGLFVRSAIGIDGVVAVVRIERGHTNRWVKVVIVGEFGSV